MIGLDFKIIYKHIIFFILIFHCINVFSQSHTAEIQGRIFDKITNNPVKGAEIIIVDTQFGTSSDKRGFYHLIIPKGQYLLRVCSIGYKKISKKISVVEGDSIKYDFYLQSIVYQSDTVLVTEKRVKEGIFDLTLSSSVIQSIPALAEDDVFRAIQTVPGVTTISDYSSQLFVRGSPSDQTLITFDDVTVYNPYHLGGLFSMFNAEGIEKIEFNPGIYSASYGGHLAGRLNIVPKTGNEKYYRLKANIGITSSKIAVGVPVKYGTFFLAGRRTYFDVLEKLFINDDPIGYYFFDIQSGYSFQITPKHQFSIQSFYSKDALTNILEDDELGINNLKQPYWGNRILSLRWHWNPDENLFLKTHLSLSKAFVKAKTIHVKADNNIRDVSLKQDILVVKEKHQFQAGFEVAQLKYFYQWMINDATNLLNIINSPEKIFFDGAPTDYEYQKNGWQGSLYIEDNYKLTVRASFRAGLRTTRHSLSSTTCLEPRFNFKYSLTDKITWSGTYAHHTQFLYTLKEINNEDIFAPFSVYFPVTEGQKPLKDIYLATGMEMQLPYQSQLKMEFYYKRMKNIPAYNESKRFTNLNKGQAGGIDLLIQRDIKKFSLFANYSLNFSKVINSEKTYFAGHHRTHNIKMMGSYKFSHGWSINLYWTFLSGLPYTPIVGKFIGAGSDTDDNVSWYIENPIGFQFGKWGLIQGEKNSLRYPDYHRLDIGISKDWQFRQLIISFRLQILNLYNKNNPLYYDWNLEYEQPKKENGKNLPILPTFEISVQF